jgi:aryl-alcohol dehydrogenase-like predicted oxidoreductase
MQYRILGRTGVKVSSLCLGTMTFGGDSDEGTSAAVYGRCREAGINFFDCADVYVGGRSEEILGGLARKERDQVILATKAYFASGEDINASGSSRRHLMLSVEGSLRRLGTDRIDLFYLHRFDATTPLDETLRALDDLVSQGKVLYLGASNFAAWQVAKGLGLSSEHGWARFECIQPMYNLVKRQAEVELLPLAAAENLGVFPYSPMGGGLLSGKYAVDQKPERGRLVENEMYITRYGAPWVMQTAQDFTALAKKYGHHPAALAVAWVGSHPAVTAPIIGARNLEQLETTLGALDIDLNEELRAEISALSPEPPPATDRNEERTPTNYGVRR